jgi:hypothetical protein
MLLTINALSQLLLQQRQQQQQLQPRVSDCRPQLKSIASRVDLSLLLPPIDSIKRDAETL